MRPASELIQQLKIDDYTKLQKALAATIKNISTQNPKDPETFNVLRFKETATNLLSAIDIRKDIGKLDLATLAYVLSCFGMPGEPIQLKDPSADHKQFFDRLAAYKVFMSAFENIKDEDDVDVIKDEEIPPAVEQTYADQKKEFVRNLFMKAIVELSDETDLCAHYAAMLTLLPDVKKGANFTLQMATTWVNQQMADFTKPYNDAAFQHFHSFLFPSKSSGAAQSTQSDEKVPPYYPDGQPPLPGGNRI